MLIDAPGYKPSKTGNKKEEKVELSEENLQATMDRLNALYE